MVEDPPDLPLDVLYDSEGEAAVTTDEGPPAEPDSLLDGRDSDSDGNERKVGLEGIVGSVARRYTWRYVSDDDSNDARPLQWLLPSPRRWIAGARLRGSGITASVTLLQSKSGLFQDS